MDSSRLDKLNKPLGTGRGTTSGQKETSAQGSSRILKNALQSDRGNLSSNLGNKRKSGDFESGGRQQQYSGNDDKRVRQDNNNNNNNNSYNNNNRPPFPPPMNMHMGPMGPMMNMPNQMGNNLTPQDMMANMMSLMMATMTGMAPLPGQHPMMNQGQHMQR